MKKKAQSEMVGFAVIIIMVAVITLVFLSISMNKPSKDYAESKDASNFLNAMLDYTTSCEINYANYLSIKKLIDNCMDNRICMDGEKSCDVLNETLVNLLNSAWNVGEEWPTKGYELNITKEGQEFKSFQKGNVTRENKGSFQSFDGGLDIFFIVYY